MTILAIHGGMAVGKTTLIQKLKEKYPMLTVDYEDISSVLIKTKGLNKSIYSEYVKNQQYFIEHEKNRMNRLKDAVFVLMDYSMEEVLYHTISHMKLNHPNKHDLETLIEDSKQYYVDRILYLSANDATLMERKLCDATRSRKSFDDYIQGIHQDKLEWFSQLDHVDVLITDGLSADCVLEEASKWLIQNGYRGDN